MYYYAATDKVKQQQDRQGTHYPVLKRTRIWNTMPHDLAHRKVQTDGSSSLTMSNNRAPRRPRAGLVNCISRDSESSASPAIYSTWQQRRLECLYGYVGYAALTLWCLSPRQQGMILFNDAFLVSYA